MLHIMCSSFRGKIVNFDQFDLLFFCINVFFDSYEMLIKHSLQNPVPLNQSKFGIVIRAIA